MISALFYLQSRSFCNRLVRRVTRLKQPKYLVGAIVGGLYFYFYFFRYLFFPQGTTRGVGLLVSPEHRALYESIGALGLFVVVLLAWIIPHERTNLAFSEAEVAFLFPAPIGRRVLIHYKLLRSQLRILVSTLFLTLFANRFGGNAWIHAVGWWLLLSTLNLHFLGCSFARTLLLDRGISNWARRAFVLGLALALVCIVAFWARSTMPAPVHADIADANAIRNYVQQVLTSGPALYLLYPFRLVARPFLSADALTLLRALGPALLIFALHYAWVVYSNVAFEEASVEASQKLAAKVAAIRSGNWQAVRQIKKAKRPWFQLAATGPTPTALLWKNLLGIGQALSWRLCISLSIMCIACYIGFSGNGHSADVFTILGCLILILLIWSLLLGPQFLRQDFRQDLPVADILKTFPMRGWQIALGEILAPVIILAGCQWVLLLVGTALLLQGRGVEGPLLLGIAFGSAFLAPMIDAVLLLIPNAAVLLFPSWIQVGREGPRGIEATGQRLLFLFGQLIVLAIALVPAAAIFVAVLFLLKLATGFPIAVPVAAVAAALVLAIEAGLGVLLLGKLFERLDLSAETNA